MADIILAFLGFLLVLAVIHAIGYVIVKVFQWFNDRK